jgi:hypothetical protein
MLLAWKVKKKAESRAKDEYNTVAAGGKSWPLPLPLPLVLGVCQTVTDSPAYQLLLYSCTTGLPCTVLVKQNTR